MDDLEYRLLTWLEGHAVFRPADHTPASRAEFQATVHRLLALRTRGLIHFLDNPTSRSESGDYLLIGPCTLSSEGRAALVKDRQLGPRAPARAPPPPTATAPEDQTAVKRGALEVQDEP